MCGSIFGLAQWAICGRDEASGPAPSPFPVAQSPSRPVAQSWPSSFALLDLVFFCAAGGIWAIGLGIALGSRPPLGRLAVYQVEPRIKPISLLSFPYCNCYPNLM